MTSEWLFNHFIPPKLLNPPKQISGYAPEHQMFCHLISTIAMWTSGGVSTSDAVQIGMASNNGEWPVRS